MIRGLQLYTAYTVHFVVWQIWLRSPNLIYANSTYSHVYYEKCTLNIVLFSKLKWPPMCITSQFAKLMFTKHTSYTITSYCKLSIIITTYLLSLSILFELYQHDNWKRISTNTAVCRNIMQLMLSSHFILKYCIFWINATFLISSQCGTI